MSDDLSREPWERRSPDRHDRNEVWHGAEKRSRDAEDAGNVGGKANPGKANPGKANREIGDPRGWFSRGYLPHYDGASVIQHVTAHLADSLPKSAIEKIERSLEMFQEERRKIERRKRVQAWIDAGYGSCILKHPDIAAMMQNTFLYFNNARYRLHAWVVMPNHFHVLVEPLNGWLLSKIVASWKKFSAKKILEYVRMADVEGGGIADSDGSATSNANREIGDPRRGDPGIGDPGIDDPRRAPRVTPRVTQPVWHREYWDRYIRNERHYEQAVAYIHNNPVAAGLVKVAEAWPWSSARGLKV